MIKTELLSTATILFQQHNLNGWKLAFRSRTGHRLGYCDHGRSVIWINDFYASNNPDAEVLDTLLHEIAHALTPGHGHDKTWKGVARRLGAVPKARCQDAVVVRPGRYQATCPSCGRIFHRYRRPRYKCHNEAVTPYFCTATALCGKERGKLVFVKVDSEAR